MKTKIHLLASQRKASDAIEAKRFKDEIVPIKVKLKQEITFDTDEYPKPDTTVEKLSSLRSAFKKDGTVTAGNASESMMEQQLSF